MQPHVHVSRAVYVCRVLFLMNLWFLPRVACIRKFNKLYIYIYYIALPLFVVPPPLKFPSRIPLTPNWISGSNIEKSNKKIDKCVCFTVSSILS